MSRLFNFNNFDIVNKDYFLLKGIIIFLNMIQNEIILTMIKKLFNYKIAKRTTLRFKNKKRLLE